MPSRQFITYAAIGVTGLTIDVALFAALVDGVGLDKQLANVVSISVAILNNFLLNVRFNFFVRNHLLARFVSFYAVGASGIALTAAILWLMVDVLSFDPLVAKLASLPLVLITQYTLNSRVSFRGANSASVDQPRRLTHR